MRILAALMLSAAIGCAADGEATLDGASGAATLDALPGEDAAPDSGGADLGSEDAASMADDTGPDAAADAPAFVDVAAPDAAPACDVTTLPYATAVVSFTPGEGAGFGQDAMPQIVLGPPELGPASAGALDVVSLGVGGEIVLAFATPILDGPGPDLIVWENPFWIGGNPDKVFAELGEVAVSPDDGQTWVAFPCDPSLEYDPGCAGWRPRLAFDPCDVTPLDPELTGGDAFDLADLGLAKATLVRIRDLATSDLPPSAGFDLDAVGVVHPE